MSHIMDYMSGIQWPKLTDSTRHYSDTCEHHPSRIPPCMKDTERPPDRIRHTHTRT